MDVLDPLRRHDAAVTVEPFAAHQLGEAEDRRERRPQLVAHARDEVALGEVRLGQGPAETYLLCVHPFALRERSSLGAEETEERPILRAEQGSMTREEDHCVLV